MTALRLPVPHPLEPMEARTSDQIPMGEEWQFEPKWDGFRCLVFRDGSDVRLQSKSRKPLARYFPEVVDAVRALRPRQFVLDAELAVPVEGRLSFDHLLQRVHPAASRVRKLSAETPASLFVFDLLATGKKTDLLDRPLEERRPRLEDWGSSYLNSADHDTERGGERSPSVELSPSTESRETAEGWLRELRGIDGIMAKRKDLPYLPGQRDAMVKVKRLRSADCVVGGFRYSSSGKVIGSLLLGLYDEEGDLHHVGYTSSFGGDEADALTQLMEDRREPPGFTGRAPGGPSRWSRGGRSSDWHPVRPDIVLEVRYDHFSGERFRHGTKLLRLRPDKAPEQCSMEQVRKAGADALRLIRPEGG